MLKLISLTVLAVAVAACGQAEQAASEKFDESFQSSCLSSASGSGVPNEIAAKACDCALAKINDTYSTTEKLTLSDAQAQPIAIECFQKAMQDNG